MNKIEYIEIPDYCPICGKPTEIRKDNDTLVLVCTNDDCQGKLLGRLCHFVSKNAINIDGLSEATLEFTINELGIKSFKDLYNIPFYPLVRTKWKNSPGFGQKSVDKLLESIEKSREIALDRFLYAQSIPLIGKSASKDISNYCNESIDTFCEMMESGAANKFLEIDGFGETMYQSLVNWKEKHWNEFLELKKEFVFKENTEQNYYNNKLNGKAFVITGSLEHFKNRDELSNLITNLGGKVVGSISKNTFALINNDINSNSSKNKKAKELNIQIITEKDFINMIN